MLSTPTLLKLRPQRSWDHLLSSELTMAVLWITEEKISKRLNVNHVRRRELIVDWHADRTF